MWVCVNFRSILVLFIRYKCVCLSLCVSVSVSVCECVGVCVCVCDSMGGEADNRCILSLCVVVSAL